MVVAWENELLAFLNFEVFGFAAYALLLLYAFLKATVILLSVAITKAVQSCIASRV